MAQGPKVKFGRDNPEARAAFERQRSESFQDSHSRGGGATGKVESPKPKQEDKGWVQMLMEALNVGGPKKK